MRVIAQHLDDPAIGYRVTGTLHHHALQFGFQGHKPRKAALNLGKLRPCNGVCSGAGLIGIVRQAEQIADCLQRKTKLAGMTDEA